ncbi:MAG: 5-formyltetrahydrofolate cyclo-ligase [Candidatus Bathyarchaeia archaeon]
MDDRLMSSNLFVKEEKERLRLRVWRTMFESGVSRPPYPCYGRIPNFSGAKEAAERVRSVPEYVKANVILVSPDSPQRPVREAVLKDEKTLVMATPRLRNGYLVIEPLTVTDVKRASSIWGAYKIGRLIKDLCAVDFVVEGCVAVDLKGNRLGKGGGFGDREIAAARRLNEEVKVAVTCHSIQVLSHVPRSSWDQPVQYIATEAALHVCG